MNSEVIITSNSENVTKSEILQWVNQAIKTNLSKIEQLGIGSPFCQLFDMIYPGKIALNKVNWKARYDYEYTYNWKLLQMAFTKNSIMKPIEMGKLVKCKTQDNLEFAQWFKKFFDVNYVQKEYDALQKRGNMDIELPYQGNGKKSSISQSFKQNNQQRYVPPPNEKKVQDKSSVSSNDQMNEEIQESVSKELQQQQNEQNTTCYDNMKQERDYYFSKLRDIDHLLEVCKDEKVETLTSKIRDILYHKPETVVIVFDDGNIKVSNKELNSTTAENDILDFEKENINIMRQQTPITEQNLLSDSHQEDLLDGSDPLKEIANFDNVDLNLQYQINENLKEEMQKQQQDNLMNLEDNLLLE